MAESRILLGCIADDFTGASDAASLIEKGGLQVQLFNGIPDNNDVLLPHVQAVVIALKTRSKDADDAVFDSIRAFEWLEEHNTLKVYFKYCSTFDSTPKGNIGPVVDALMKRMDVKYTLLCPAFPENGRTVSGGNLYVNGVPLHKSHMKDHPLNPMWDSRIANLMYPQGKWECLELHSDGYSDIAWVNKTLEEYGKHRTRFYIVPDYKCDEDGLIIVKAFSDMSLYTGGSGLLEHLARYLNDNNDNNGEQLALSPKTPGRALILAGSCSKVTLEQIHDYIDRGGKSLKIDPLSICKTHDEVDNAKIWIKNNNDLLVYSSDSPEKVAVVQDLIGEDAALCLEEAFAELAEYAIDNGFSRLIVAGGETSGAVIRQLGYKSYLISQSVAPGVPVMIPVANDRIRVVLKSGGFGQKDFFAKALEKTSL